MKYSLAILTVMLSGCAAPVMLGAGIASVAVNETTGKSISDHAVSTVEDQDCRLFRWFKGEKICQLKPNAVVTVSVPSQPVIVAKGSVKDMEAAFALRKAAK